MKVLMLSSSVSGTRGNGGLMQQLAIALGERGHEVDILAMFAGEAGGEGPLESAEPRVRAFVLHGTAVAARPGLTKYFPNAWRLNANPQLRAWMKDRYDAVLLSTPTLLSAGAPKRWKRAGRVGVIGVFLWDFFPVANIEAGVRGLTGIAGPLKYLEGRTLQAADVLFTMSPASDDFLGSYYGLSDRVTVVVPPWGAPTSVRGTGEKFARFTCVWGGQFIPLRSFTDTLAAAAIVSAQDPNVDFRLAGDGPLLDDARRQASEMKLSNVRFEGRLDRDDFLALLHRSHLGLSLLGPASSPSFPSKTADYCQAGLPMVVSSPDCSDYAQILEASGAAIGVSSGDVQAIASGIVKIRNAADREWSTMSNASRDLFDRHLSVAVAAEAVEHALAAEMPGPQP